MKVPRFDFIIRFRTKKTTWGIPNPFYSPSLDMWVAMKEVGEGIAYGYQQGLVEGPTLADKQINDRHIGEGERFDASNLG